MEDPKCTLCQDTGWTTREVEGVRYADRCECAAEKYSGQLTPKAQIPSKYAGCSLGNFVMPERAKDHLQQTFILIQAYVREFPMRKDPRGILLSGGNGIGKTHLAVAAFRDILAKGYEGRFVNYQALLRMIKADYALGVGQQSEETNRLAEVDVLLLDDLGSNRATDWVEDTITDLIAQRYDSERATIVTTNCLPRATSRISAEPIRLADRSQPLAYGGPEYLGDMIGERATSRLRDMCKILEMPSNIPDYRGTVS